ncbi:zinc-binding dehydrogenase [Eudoraea chungangensis]|uniref:zinc-binding dehydrogenase n=1 Tax=Eudoraea chungangensis TaxID=1481905 RepID=UPI0023EB21A3|nr:zinc-binding dehydrogenase [Eudoraea chungangensis]
MTNSAVVNYAPKKGSVEIREITPPKIGLTDVLLQVENVGVCGSDLHQWTADHSWPVNYPVVLGHEFGGHIVALGKDVRDWKEGDAVVSETAAVINSKSPLSLQGLYNLDPDRKGFGYGVNGAMTKFVKVPARCLHKIPKGLGFQEACLTEPCSVAYNAVVVNSNIKPGDRVLILGPGTIGILCAAIAILTGAEVAMVGLEKDASRLAIAQSYGCTPIIKDASSWAKEVDGLGVDCVIDAAGVSETLRLALKWVRPNGHITKVGWGPQPFSASLDPLVQKNVTLKGSFSHNWPIWEKVLALLATKRLDVQPIIGGVWKLEDWHTAFNAMHSGEVVKSVLKP